MYHFDVSQPVAGKASIEINKPVTEVFRFVVDPPMINLTLYPSILPERWRGFHTRCRTASIPGGRRRKFLNF